MRDQKESSGVSGSLFISVHCSPELIIASILQLKTVRSREWYDWLVPRSVNPGPVILIRPSKGVTGQAAGPSIR